MYLNVSITLHCYGYDSILSFTGPFWPLKVPFLQENGKMFLKCRVLVDGDILAITFNWLCNKPYRADRIPLICIWQQTVKVPKFCQRYKIYFYMHILLFLACDFTVHSQKFSLDLDFLRRQFLEHHHNMTMTNQRFASVAWAYAFCFLHAR